MKILLHYLLATSLLLTVTGCGQKPTSSGSKVKSVVELDNGTIQMREILEELSRAIDQKKLPEIKSILATNHTLDLNLLLDSGETLLTHATNKNYLEAIEALTAREASVHKSNKNKETPLMVAARNGYLPLVMYFMTVGGKPDNKNAQGNTALQLAIMNKHESVALYLINNGANLDITNDEDLSALKLAEEAGLKKAADLIRHLTQASLTMPSAAEVLSLFRNGTAQTLGPILSRYPTLVHEYKTLNLYVVVMDAHHHDEAASIVNLMLAHNADVNGAEDVKPTPLIRAVEKGYADFMQLFLDKNAEVNEIDSKGKSALIYAVERNHSMMVKALRDKGALKKYTHYENDKKEKVNACDVARSVKKMLKEKADKEKNEEILEHLGCGLRWLF